MGKHWKGKEEALLLVLYDEGLTYGEIAECLNLDFSNERTEKSVENAISKLRKRYSLPKRAEIKKAKVNSSPKNEVKLEDKKPKVEIENAKVDKTPEQNKVVKTQVDSRMINRSKNRRNSMKWTVAEDMILIAHYGRCNNEELVENLGRSVAAIQNRYRIITKDKNYVGNLVIAGLENANLNLTIKDDKVVISKKPSRFKRWKMRRMERKAKKANLKAIKLERKLKGMKE
tara:strand:- start:10456 stop:11145 length:690 start_codon:yes stop_codon:yes gene_type:complete